MKIENKYKFLILAIIILSILFCYYKYSIYKNEKIKKEQSIKVTAKYKLAVNSCINDIENNILPKTATTPDELNNLSNKDFLNSIPANDQTQNYTKIVNLLDTILNNLDNDIANIKSLTVPIKYKNENKQFLNSMISFRNTIKNTRTWYSDNTYNAETVLDTKNVLIVGNFIDQEDEKLSILEQGRVSLKSSVNELTSYLKSN